MNCYARTDIGRARSMNQDSLFASGEPVGSLPNLFIVADGMGGHKAGDFASRFVIEHVRELIEEQKQGEPVMILRRAIERTSRLLYEETKGDVSREGTGSTIVAATVVGDTLYVANVGDSRLYILHDSLEQVTRDHSLVEEMVSRGMLERGSESYQKQKNIITRAMGDPWVQADVFEAQLKAGDLILLCSDGLTNMVSDPEIARILKSGGSLKDRTDALIAAANENGGRDNIAVVLAAPQISEVSL